MATVTAEVFLSSNPLPKSIGCVTCDPKDSPFDVEAIEASGQAYHLIVQPDDMRAQA